MEVMVILGFSRENGTENGNYYLGFRVWVALRSRISRVVICLFLAGRLALGQDWRLFCS